MTLPSLDGDHIVPLLVYELSLYAQAKVNGREGLAFLDSAATEASLHPDWARSLPRAEPITVRSAFEARTYETVNATLEFLGVIAPPQRTLVHAAREIVPSFEVPMVLNASVMFAAPLVLDFRTLAVYRPDAVADLAWQEVPARRARQGLWLLELTAPRGPAWALFDTGAGLTVFNAAHLDDLGLDLRPGYRLRVTDATDAAAYQDIVACQGLSVAGRPLPGDGFVVDLTAVEQALAHRVDLVLGVTTFLRSGLRWRFEPASGRAWVG